ncbi:molybdenum ABC transporter ATP-binding protein [Desulfobacter hydrogenophilus]|uniref:Molybdenum ABC transporter ATP-binding protein n=1 Tax=Desulfobacter hydrogenophilus TaxID=2291 RepID=A0A328F706_9BACT|nr:molybdenum ABC transporter ATP-binding protein [Desulfobacter hydrogenophilus]NDY73906.1 molybdenum ABC transporter ATP-binding protein [Desulfobacter hydrogenophilus]QBH12068.1 molybdenum ABC transporter ATP-binding protein [Desulfobacter hydrogenophilus]RAM00351.1 molybdenum ABC transporter ATP-binding protein [Desulfobacter hydrogenophilus]
MQLDVELKKSFKDFTLDVAFSLSSPRTGIFGPSGSGKSTIMNLLSGLELPDSGFIRLGDTVLFDAKRKINLKPNQRNIGVVFQHAHLFPHMSVKKNLFYGYKRIKLENRQIDPEGLFKVLGITQLLSRDVSTLSGGERQRIALARTVLSNPRLILMDEPLSALDEGHKFQIIPYLKNVFNNYGIPMIFISHSVLEMRMMTDEVFVIQKGRIQRHSAAEELVRKSWGSGLESYVNLINLGGATPCKDLFRYKWGHINFILTEPAEGEENLFELDSRDILLFKRHPEATSARNLLQCTVTDIYSSGNRVRVGLACGNEHLIAQIVSESVRELGIEEGAMVVAAIKASAFKKIF